MASSGTKRPYHADDPRSHDGEGGDGGKRSKQPRDWRDAFLEEDQPRRERGAASGGSGSGSGGGREDRYVREREEGHHNHHHHHRHGDHHRERERERAESSRRYGDTRDQRRDRDRDRDYDREREYPRQSSHRDRDRDRDRDHDNRRRSGNGGREEGEIERSPPKQQTQASVQASPSRPGMMDERSPRRDGPSQPRGFQAVSIPTGPKSRIPQTRPAPNDLPTGNAGQGVNPTEQEIEVEEKDPETILEERRRKRAEIMAKFQAQGRKENSVDTPKVGSPAPDAVGGGGESVTSAGTKTGLHTASGATPLLKQLGTRSTSLLPSSAQTPTGMREPSLAPTPQGHDFDLSKQAETTGDAVIPVETKNEDIGADMTISAADYDPTQDMKSDREKRIKDMEAAHVDVRDVADGVGEPVQPAPAAKQQNDDDEWEEVEIEVDDEDDDVDMFAMFDDEGAEKKKKKITVRRLKNAGANGDRKQQEVVRKSGGGAGGGGAKNAAAVLQIVDNVDDTDGYYRITPGEILDDGRYQVTITLGKGMFSAVVKAKVLKAVDQERRQDVVGKEVAIKVIRSQESMYVAGRKEADILKKLNDADPDDRKHIVRLERTFEHRGHLCIVTESLSMNLRDVIKRFGKDVGLNMRAVRAYAHQMFLALSLMRKCSIVHADIKPDNILASENKATLKVCDLGSASDVKDGEITPYLVSRFYRAPEIILGLPYDTAIDVWSIGCTLYELYTGKILFPGRSNNHMLLLMMEVKGKLNHRMIKKATLGEMHFDEQMNFISIEQDKITRQDVAKTLNISKATRDLKSRLMPASSVQLKMKDDELKQLQHFVDLLDKCLQLDPARRITPREALLHPFLAA